MKRMLFSAFVALFLTTNIAVVQASENPSVIGHFPNQIMVTVKSGIKMDTSKAASNMHVGVKAMDTLADQFQIYGMTQFYAGLTSNFTDKSTQEYFDRIWCVEFPEEMDIKKVQAAYEALPEVEIAEQVDICEIHDATLPNDPGLNGSQYYIRNMEVGGADLRCVGAWSETVGDSNVVIAIIDTGMDYNHPDLGGTHPDRVNGALWTNWDEYYGTPGVDDDGNGKVDDFRGWDFVNISASQGWPEEDVTHEDNDPMDFAGHGTNCAGCAAGIANNGIGVAGVAHGCKIMSLRAGWIPVGTENGVVGMNFAAAAILYAANNGANIINCSWGSSYQIGSAVSAAQAQGLLILASAGNSDDEVASYLATRTGVLAVASTTSADIKSDFSSFGTWVEISAPGSGIYTTGYQRSTGQSVYEYVSGTSFSCPITAGAAALLWSAHPTYTASEISNLLTSTCDPIDQLNPSYQGKLGAGRVNLRRALGDNIQLFPGEYPTIFDAQNCAGFGDVIAIEGGITIDEAVIIHGDKELQILAGYDPTYTTRDPLGNPCTIQGGPTGPAISFYGSVDNATVVDGFIVQGGGGRFYSGIPFSGKFGGGVVMNNSSPTLRNMVFTSNSVGSNTQIGGGGAIMMNSSSAILENIEIYGNTALFGGGIFANNSDFSLVNVNIHDNLVITNNISHAPLGGGLHLIDSVVSMTGCSVDGHLGCDMGGGVYMTTSTGASSLTMTSSSVTNNEAKTAGCGIYISDGAIDFNVVEVSGNVPAGDATFCNGGGFNFINSTVAMDSVTCFDNNAHIGAGGFIDEATNADVEHSVFHGNIAVYYGGGLVYQDVSNGSITGNTFVGNEGTFSGGGAFYINNSNPFISNNLVAFNTGSTSLANGIHAVTSAPTFSCNDVFGNIGSNYGDITDPTGTDGNISADPLFCNFDESDFGVSADSPCASESCGLIGALAPGCGTNPAIDDTGLLVPLVFKVEQNYPNPFNPSTTISFSLPVAGHTNVAIYNVAGHLVKTLLNETMSADTHNVVWTGRDDNDRSVATGIYFYMVSSGENRDVGRMALVK